MDEKYHKYFYILILIVVIICVLSAIFDEFEAIVKEFVIYIVFFLMIFRDYFSS